MHTTHATANLLRRRALYATLAGALILSLAACGRPSAPASNGNAASATIEAMSGTAADARQKSGDSSLTPPDGTLHYTIELTGDLHRAGTHAGEKRDATIRRKLEISMRMHAMPGNGGLAEVNPDHPGRAAPPRLAATPLDNMAREAEHCNGDVACMTRISMRLMADAHAQQAVQRAGEQMVHQLGRTVVWMQSVPCQAHTTINDDDDRATWWEDVGEGYDHTGLDKRRIATRADLTADCVPNLPPDDPVAAALMVADGTRLFFDRQTGEYDITFGPHLVDAATSVNGKPGKARKAGIPKIVLIGLHGAALGKPIKGSKSVQVEDEDHVPLHATLTWTFTPDAS